MAWANIGEGTDLVLYDRFLKEWYISQWIDLQNNLTTTYKMFRRRIVPFKGRRMVLALRVGRTGAVEPIPLSGFAGGTSGEVSKGAPSTVTPGYQPLDNAYVRPKVLMTGIGIPQDVIDTSIGDRAAFYDVVDMEMQGAKVDTANYQDLQCYRGGTYLATAVDADPSAGGAPVGDALVSNIFPFFKNKRIQIFEPATNNERSYTTGTYTVVQNAIRQYAGPPAGHYISFSPTSSAADLIADDDELWTKGARGQFSVANDCAIEMLGLNQIVSNSNLLLKNYEGNNYYLGIDRTNNELWQSQELNLNGRLTFDAMQSMIDDIHDNSGGETSLILTTRPTRREYAKKCGFSGYSAASPTEEGAYLRFQGSTKYKQGLVSFKEDDHYAGGSDWMMFDDRIPIVVDRYCDHNYSTQDGTMYFLDTRHFYFALVTDWRWWAPEGRILREAQNNMFGVVGHAYILGEMVCDAPNTCGKIYGITV